MVTTSKGTISTVNGNKRSSIESKRDIKQISNPSDEESMLHAPQSENATSQIPLDLHATLIETIGFCVTEFLAATSIQTALMAAMPAVAQVARVDRLSLTETTRNASGKDVETIYFSWSHPDAPALVGPEMLINDEALKAATIDWSHRLHQGQSVVATQHSDGPVVKGFLGAMGVTSVLLVPIMVHGQHWGQIALEDCRGEHDWNITEIGVLKIFAEVIGTGITRERSLTELARRDALMRAVAVSATEIVTAPHLHEAISTSVERVAKAVGADRMLVLEAVQSAGSQGEMLLRHAWHVPHVSMELETILRATTGPLAADFLVWTAPLREGRAIIGAYGSAVGGIRDLFACLKLQSTLIVPIMVDGNFWGQISFDDCSQERLWLAAEVDILITIAELIGTAITRERYVEEIGKANMIVQNSPTILYRLKGEPSFPMIYISQNVALLGHDPAELVNSPTLYLSYIHPEDRGTLQAALGEILRKDAAPSMVEIRMLTSKGDSRWVENRYAPVRDSNGRLVEVEGIMIDITDRKIAEEKIAHLARTDALTGLANRSTFSNRLRQAFAAAHRGARPFAVMYLDLDRFKEVNDTLGHPVGDRLLQTVAERLIGITREADAVARLGGDEFAILQTEIADSAAAGTLADKIVVEISKPYLIDGHELQIGVSVGISVCTDDIATAEILVAQADQALYRSKEEGRGRYCFHSEVIDAQIRNRVALLEELRSALDHGELKLDYQPQMELTSGQIVGMEAVLRWNHPVRGLLQSDVLLPIAEKSGIMAVIGRWMLDRACQQMAQWRNANIPVPVVAINVSLAQLKTGREFVRDVTECLTRWGMTPNELELDVTELILARTTLSQNDVLEQLHRLGVRIAIDDFGAQYSSLDYLRTHHISRLKIAPPTMAAGTNERGGSAMIRAIIGLAGELGIEVITESMGTEAQKQIMSDSGIVTLGEGFYYGAALQARQATDLLRADQID